MTTIFSLTDATTDSTKINLDDLYERKKQQDLNTVSLYNKVLNRIHTRIKTVSRQQTKEQFCWFVMPETIIGVPKYDAGACTVYIIDQLRENGFVVKYTHPNLLLISWAAWCPSYVRNEIKKKTGVVIDGTGNKVDKSSSNDGNPYHKNNHNNESDDPNELMFHRSGKITIEPTKPNKEYKPIDTYKPSGLIYNENLLRRIEDKTQ